MSDAVTLGKIITVRVQAAIKPIVERSDEGRLISRYTALASISRMQPVPIGPATLPIRISKTFAVPICTELPFISIEPRDSAPKTESCVPTA